MRFAPMGKLSQALAHHASVAGAQIAMSDGRRSLTRSELAGWVGGVAHDLGPARETVGLFGNNSVEWAVAFLAASVAGKTIVPIPVFFSEGQHSHLIRDAGIARVILTDGQSSNGFSRSVPVYRLAERAGAGLPAQGRDGGLIIYTSGSTGYPKGVRLVSGQALWSSLTLAKAIGANSEDKYLSVLPLPLLLELICGIMIPVLVGGSVHYDGIVAQSAGVGALCNIAEAFERASPTTSVLVPQLLALYAGQLAASGRRPPAGLRFVAVGGAAVPQALSRAAADLGIPVFEGYGLSECSSVVAVNRPGALREGTAGQPLPGVEVAIEDGEIVVQGPSIMDGYLHGGAAPARWRTGDAGSLDPDGFLTVFGRLDNLIVTPYGRNLSPEWIETMLAGDPRIGACVICQAGEPARLTVLLIPSRLGEGWFRAAAEKEIAALVSRACESAPDYACPQRAAVISREDASRQGLFTPNGRPRRAGVQRYLQDEVPTFEVQR
ncbi:MAG: AMP-binding protein [Rhodomicrobium sp.]